MDSLQKFQDTLAKLREELQSDEFEYRCWLGCENITLYDGETFEQVGVRQDKDRRGIKKTVFVDWDTETIDGYVVSRYPIFEVDPPCQGPYDWQNHEHDKRGCPFSSWADPMCEPQQEIMAAYRERRRLARIAGMDVRP